jgi:Asp-tRNA(Asn)/Glu-tRNA(Gln) amidotransferase A subunit family amidase
VSEDPAIALPRRAFLWAVAAGAAACRRGAPTETPATAPAPTKAAPAAADGIDVATIAAAERIAGVRYTDAERKLLATTLGAHVERARTRRATPLPDDVAPATVFDPRLPGREYGPKRATFRPEPARASAITRDEDLAFASLSVLAEQLRRRAITSERLTELYLDRLRTHDPKLHCVARTTDALAREQARAADRELARGRVRGPLHGIPWGAKDLLDTAGIATTWGAEPMRDRVPTRDATVVGRLHAAGAVLVAKLTTGALAYGDIWDAGVTRNPWNPLEGSSGSSAGPAAAVAAGLVGFAIGTETLGSIVSPSMRCGTAGLRPTFGRVPRTGCMPLCWSMDKIGPITRHVDDAMRVFSVIAGTDDLDPSARTVPLSYDARASVKGLRVGHVPAWFEADATDADRAALAALRELGVDLRAVEAPKVPVDPLLTVLFAEAAATFERLVLDDRDDELDWQGADAWPNTFRAARFVTAIDLVNADRVRRQVMTALDRMFADLDAFVGPSFAGPMLVATNFTGHPCVVVRAGFVERAPEPGTDGTPPPAGAAKFSAPHGVSLWGRIDDEGTIGRLGVALERALTVADRRPPGF